MKPSALVRPVAVSALLGAAALSAHADLKIPFGWSQSNSVQKFPLEALQTFDLAYVEVAAKGNTTSLGDVPDGLFIQNAQSYKLPVTEIVIGPKLNIAAGSATGSALQFRRALDDGTIVGLTLANFTINYDAKQVSADAKPFGGAIARIPVYNFHVATPLALKYKFPLTVTGHEVLDQLKLTDQAKQAFTDGLKLEPFESAQLGIDFGTLTQDISTNLRMPKLASTKPYVPTE